jgi:membrane-bound lytic murein transglycosylase F
MNKNLYPRARAAFDISDTEYLGWAFARQNDKSLLREVDKFFAKSKTQKQITRYMDIYYGHVDELNFSDSLLFAKRLEHRLPKWKDELIVAAQRNELDWHLLAALSYQESHWNPRAVSRTGVKGFMMLTRAAAKEVGVKNRYNAEKSIQGGAKYFKKIYDRIPERIENPDRTWLALAAYNVGFGHLEDARKLTEHFGGDPDRWSDVKDNLLLLSKRKYYTGTRHGYARGWEAVDYVQNIRNFYNIIAWHQRENERERNVAIHNQVRYAELNPSLTEAVQSVSGVSAEL